MTPTLAIRYVVQIGLALRTAHKAGVIHGDLKPENILLDDVGNALLSDFALTRLTRSAETMLRRAYVGYGSLGYMAPETFRPGQAAEPANDIYALGILMYEMFSGHLPGRRSPMPSEVVEAVPAAVDDIFDRMTRDALDQRVSSIDEVLEALWSSPEIRELLDHRTGPFFIDRPVDLPGLEYAVMEPMPAVTAASPSSPPKPRGENASAEDGSAAEAGDFADHLGEARWSGNETALGADADDHSARVEVITEGREPSIADGRQGLHEADDADHPLSPFVTNALLRHTVTPHQLMATPRRTRTMSVSAKLSKLTLEHLNPSWKTGRHRMRVVQSHGVVGCLLPLSGRGPLRRLRSRLWMEYRMCWHPARLSPHLMRVILNRQTPKGHGVANHVVALANPM